MSLFSRLSAAGTRALMRARGLAEERHELGGGWTLRAWSHPGKVDPGSATSPGSPGPSVPDTCEHWLLLHGLGASPATWLPLLGGALREHEVLAPALSSLGGSLGPTSALGVDDGVARLAELLERRWPGKKVTVAGVSLGGWIAVRLALARPDLVARLLLVVPGGYRHQDWDRIERTVHIGNYADSNAIWAALFHRPPWFLRWGRPFLYLAYRSEAVAAALDTVREEDAFDDAELATLDLPVGLIWGESDLLFHVDDGRRMAAAIPGARIWTIPAAGHGVQWEKPTEFLAAVEAFRAAMPLGASPAGAATTG